MITIAIIEDDPEFAALIQKKIMSEHNWQELTEVDIYDCPLEFLRNTVDKTYDVCFMDVRMPDMNGMEVARRLRMRDSKAILIFVSSYVQYAIHGYQVYAFDYLLKSQMDEKWETLISRLTEALKERREQIYLIKQSNRIEQIPVNSISHIYKQEKYAIFVLESGEISVRKPLQTVFEELKNYKQFVRVKRGIIVNIENIRKATASEIIMKNGEIINVGRIHVEQVRKQIHSYVGSIT